MFARLDAVPLAEVRGELQIIEALAREIGDLKAVLQARLSCDQLRLVWSLQDVVERIGLAESILREHRLIDGLARHLPESAAAIAEIRRHVLGNEVVSEEPY